MQEKRKKVILSNRQELMNDDFIERAERAGIELEKGAVITTEYLERNYDDLCKWVNLFTAYPDYYLDIIRPADSEFSLFFYQRFTLRALMRFKDIFITAPRAFSKSFITILALFVLSPVLKDSSRTRPFPRAYHAWAKEHSRERGTPH